MNEPAVTAVTAQRNTLGLIALIVGIVGSVMACSSRLMTAGWVVLAIAFGLGTVGMLQSGKSRKTSVAAMVVSVTGALVSAAIVVLGVSQFLAEAVWDLLRPIFIDSGRP